MTSKRLSYPIQKLLIIFFWLTVLNKQNRANNGGNYKRSGYVQYVTVILANIPARTTFIDMYLGLFSLFWYVDIPRSVLVRAHTKYLGLFSLFWYVHVP